MMTLVLGGTRSGKSRYAERLAAATAGQSGLGVRYVATAQVDPSDAAHRERVAAHRARRPASWSTAECGAPDDLLDLLRTDHAVLVDSMGSWMVRYPDFEVDLDALDAVWRDRAAPTVLVSEEVGLAVHPQSAAGRRYVDALGRLNEHLATLADRAVLVVAGRPLELGSAAVPEPRDR